MAKQRVSSDAYGPLWRRRIAAAVEPHGRLKAIADAAGMESPQLQKIANGTTVNPGVVVLTRIAHAIGMTLGELVTEPGPGKAVARVTGQTDQSVAVLERLLAAVDQETPAEDSWRGDVLKAIAALNRALRRTDKGASPSASNSQAENSRR